MTTYTIKEYQQHLETVGKRLNPMAVRVLNRAGFNMKKDWRARAAADNRRHARGYAGTIIMRRTIVDSRGEITVTVEPGPWGQGKFARILERGGRFNTPQRNDVAVVDAELPNVQRWLAKIAKDALK